MPQLEWNELDFLQCLAVQPEVEEYETAHTYTVTDGALTLVLTLWQYDSVAEFTLSRAGAEKPIMRFALIIRDRVRYRGEKWGESLEFRDCMFVPRRFWGTALGDVFERGISQPA